MARGSSLKRFGGNVLSDPEGTWVSRRFQQGQFKRVTGSDLFLRGRND